MRDVIEKYLRLAPRDAGNDGGSNAAGGQGSAGGQGGGGAGGAGGDGQGSGGGPGGDGAGQGGEGSGQSGSGNEPLAAYFPEGIPDDWKGKDARETIDKLFAVAKGYRDRDAGRDVPEKPEGYLTIEGLDEKAFKLDERFKPHFEFFSQDPGMIAAARVAKEAGVSRPVFLKAMQESMAALQEAGLLEPMVDAAAERAALLPDSHRNAPKDEQERAINRRMEENLAFVELMVQNRGLPKEAGEYAQLMLADTAKGHLFLEWVRGQVQGGGSGPGAHGQGGGGADTAESLKAELALPKHTPGHPDFDRKSYDALQERYKKVHGSGLPTN